MSLCRLYPSARVCNTWNLVKEIISNYKFLCNRRVCIQDKKWMMRSRNATGDYVNPK